jgi:hypothetical protein
MKEIQLPIREIHAESLIPQLECYHPECTKKAVHLHTAPGDLLRGYCDDHRKEALIVEAIDALEHWCQLCKDHFMAGSILTCSHCHNTRTLRNLRREAGR